MVMHSQGTGSVSSVSEATQSVWSGYQASKVLQVTLKVVIAIFVVVIDALL